MKKSRIIIITVIITLVVVFVIGAVIKSKTKPAEKGAKVRIEAAQLGELIEFVSAPGEIEPKTKVAISAKVSARIIELPYDEGDVVTCGAPDATSPVLASILVRMDAKNLESQLRSAKASYKAQSAQINVEKSRVASQKSNLEGADSLLRNAGSDMQRQNNCSNHRISVRQCSIRRNVRITSLRRGMRQQCTD